MNPNEMRMTELMKAMPLFEALPVHLMKVIAQRAELLELRRGDPLWIKGNPSDFCAVVTDGLIEIIDSSPSGNDRTLGMFGPGDVIGLSALLRRTPYPANAIAATKSVQCIRLFLRGLEEEVPAVSLNALQNWYRTQILRHEQALHDKLLILGCDSLHSRLVEMFERLRLKLAKDNDQDHFTIPYAITKTQMAKFVEARVESVIRCLNRWEKAGYLSMTDTSMSIKKFDQIRTMRGFEN